MLYSAMMRYLKKAVWVSGVLLILGYDGCVVAGSSYLPKELAIFEATVEANSSHLNSKSTSDVNEKLKKTIKNPPYLKAFLKESEPLVKRSQSRVRSTIRAATNEHTFGDSKSKATLYFFISFSMPNKLIEEILMDAALTKGHVILRGITPKMTLKTFLLQKILPLEKKNKMNVVIDINPNLFSAYAIRQVPTVVLSTQSEAFACHGSFQPSVSQNRKSLLHAPCDAVSEASYWKVSGNVALKWALEHFLQQGASAHLFLERLSNPPGLKQVIVSGQDL